jgi:hypothetical protein
MKPSFIWRMLATVLVLSPLTALATTPVGTAFTYQGALQDAGQPANGTYDFQFRLFDDSTAGGQVGPTVPVQNLAVAGGVFTALLDFGAGAFGPNARWLEIGVRPGPASDPTPYTILSPRQSVTGAPVALFSLNSGDNHWSQTGNAITNANTGGFVGINRSSPITGAEYFGIQAPVNGYGGMYIATNGASGQPFYGYSAGSASAWHYLDGATGNWNLYNSRLAMTVTPAGNLGLGTQAPGARLDATTSSGDGISGSSSATFSNGVHGTGLFAGVRGDCGAWDGYGVYGINNNATGTGVRGVAGGNGGTGVAGQADFGTGVYGQTSTGYGVYGSNGGSDVTGYAGYFNGRVHIAGVLSKASGSFKIDHPLDPLNKTLSHSFVESPDMMNIYNGNVTTDENGRATVQLPSYFEALNQDFRYQLTALGEFAQAMVEQEIKGNAFVIRTDKPGVRVSWQVTGVRHDAWAVTHPILVEEVKPEGERGKYLNPGAYPTSSNTLEPAAQPGTAPAAVAGTAR